MNAVKAKAEYIDIDAYSPLQLIEKIGRTCYKSEEKITDDSAVAFVQGLKNRNHWAMLEHAHVILKASEGLGYAFLRELDAYDLERAVPSVRLRDYLNISHIVFNAPMCSKNFYYISGSFRAMLQVLQIAEDPNNFVTRSLGNVLHEYCDVVFTERYKTMFEEVSEFPCFQVLSRKEFIKDAHVVFEDDYGEAYFEEAEAESEAIISRHLVHTVIFTCDRGVSHEFVRHRPCSFGQESTRYCNYSQGKFGNGITVISPLYWDGSDGQPRNEECMQIWKDACEYAETAYLKLLELGAKPQQARAVLPNSLKTEIAITANEVEWQHIINLRYHGTTGAPHPQMVEAMTCAYPSLVKHSGKRLH